MVNGDHLDVPISGGKSSTNSGRSKLENQVITIGTGVHIHCWMIRYTGECNADDDTSVYLL